MIRIEIEAKVDGVAIRHPSGSGLEVSILEDDGDPVMRERAARLAAQGVYEALCAKFEIKSLIQAVSGLSNEEMTFLHNEWPKRLAEIRGAA